MLTTCQLTVIVKHRVSYDILLRDVLILYTPSDFVDDVIVDERILVVSVIFITKIKLLDIATCELHTYV